MAEIKDLSTTDANNTGTAANAGFPENMAYSDVNNAARALEGMIARLYADTNGTVTTTGSSNAYLLTPNQTVAAYAAGDRYVFKASFTNTGAVTINVSSIGAKSIVKPSGDALASGEIASGGLYEIIYDGTNFQMQGADDPENLTLTSLTVTGTTALNGNTTIGDAATDTVTITADVASDLIPSADGTHDLGAVGSEWQDLFIDGTANIDSLVADTADIDGGTVDGVVIGGASAAAGTFTTLVANTSLNIAGDGATVTGIKDEDNMASDSATKLATQQSIKAYVDSQVTAQDLDVISDSGNISVDLDSQSLTLTGGSGLDTSATGQTVTIAIDSTVATLTGSQTLTNKTLTAPVISTISNTGTITLPTATDTLVGRDTSDTLTNKTLTSAVLNTAVSGTAVLDEDDMSSNSSTQIATQQSIKAYVDSQVTAQDLDVTDGSSSIDIDLDSESLGILGGTGIDSTASGTGVTLAIDATVATLTGSQTLSNKTLPNAILNTGVSGTAILDEDNMASDSATQLATQQSIKAYVDSQVATADTLTEVLANGNATGGTDIAVGTGDDITFADNSKAIFGSDLQIYHDGTHSRIIENNATGQLKIQGNNMQLLTSDGSSTYLEGNASTGAVTLYHLSNAPRISTTATGIDVTGSVTADGLTVDGVSNLNGVAQVGGTTDLLYLSGKTGTHAYVSLGGSSTAADFFIGADTAIPLIFRTAATERMRIDGSTGNVGIGVTPSTLLSSSYKALQIGLGASIAAHTAAGNAMKIGSNMVYEGTAPNFYDKYLTSATAAKYELDVHGHKWNYAAAGTAGDAISWSEVMRIDNSGVVKLITANDTAGTSKFLTFGTNSFNRAGIKCTNAATYDGSLEFYTGNASNFGERARIGPTGLFSIGHTNPVTPLDVQGAIQSRESGGDFIRMQTDGSNNIFDINSGDYVFRTAGFAQKLRITSGGLDVTGRITATSNHSQLTLTDSDDSKFALVSYSGGKYVVRNNSTDTSVNQFTLTEDGKFGLGTLTPATPLEVRTSSDTEISAIRTGSVSAKFGAFASGESRLTSAGNSAFWTFYTSSAERARIDANGDFLKDCSSAPSASVPGFAVRNLAHGWIHTSYDSTSIRTHHNFFNPNGSVGTITTAASATQYNTSSDQRLKENIQDAEDAGALIDAIQVRQFDWKADGSHQRFGMVAQELTTVAPEAVSTPEDPDEMMGVDYSKLVPMLIKEIQTLRDRVKKLETE